jgi:hypothetical protein
MEKSRRLRIGIFEEDPTTLVHLHKYLSLVEHIAIACIKGEETLETSLEATKKQLTHSTSPPYDLLIIDVPFTDLTADRQIFKHLIDITSLNQLPIIVITDINHLDQKLIQAAMPHTHFLSCQPIYITKILYIIAIETGIVPPSSTTFFERLRQIQYDHLQRMQQDEHFWIEQRQTWLNQRKEWTEQRQTWLKERLVWLNNQRLFSNPQLEWLEQQEEWVQQQFQDVKQQRLWIEQLQLWITRYRNRIDPQDPPSLLQAQ